MVKIYDYVFITNLPAFYKVNLYNKISDELNIKVIFFSETSEIRDDDFSSESFNFDHCYINKKTNFESRNKISSLFRLMFELSKINYKRIVFPGWELRELFFLSYISPKSKNSVVIESSINETKTTGFTWYLKTLFLNRMSLAFPSGRLQNEILELSNFKGDIEVTHGVGLINRNAEHHDSSCCYSELSHFKYIYVGRLSEEKNLELLISAFNTNKKELTIVGDGPLLDKLRHVSNDNISFTGYINNNKLKEMYQSHHVFILPSRSEPWGLVIDESLSYGLPVVVSNQVGCQDDLVIELNTGLVFDYSSLSSLQEAITSMENKYAIFKNSVDSHDFTLRDINQVQSYINKR